MAEEKFDYSKQPGLERTRIYAPDPKDALVSVITPFYNAGKYFEQTFNSVMNQTFPWFEWIIVNDGSTKEEDIELLESVASRDSRITVVTQKNGGLSCARNTGVKNTHTEFIVPLDADDVIAPTYLECMYWALHYNPQAAWCYTGSYGFQEQQYIWKYHFDAEKLKTYNFLVYSAMIRKKDLIEVGGYKVEKWSYYEDWRFWLEMLSMGKKPVHVETCLFWYRRLDNGMLSTINKDPERVKFCSDIIEQAGKNIDTSIQALEYPVSCSQFPFYATRFQTWKRSVTDIHRGKNILWLIPWMTMGGADKFNLDAIAGLSKCGFNNSIIMTQAGKDDWKQKFEQYTDDIFCLPEFLDSAHYLEFVGYFIQSREIDVVMVTNSYDGYYMIPWIRQYFPQVVIVDYVHMEEWYWRAGGYARTSGAVSGLVEKTYVCNSATKRVMCEKFGRQENSVECLYIGVDHKYYSREQENAGYLHKKLNLEAERPIILFPCRIHPQKRPFMLLEIADRVKKEIENAAFVVIGDGPQLDELKKTIKSKKLENTVFCMGRTDEMRACYRDSKITLICSLKEGLALTAYESLAMGVPVISSDVGGQSDLISSDVGALIPLAQDEEQDLDNRNFEEKELKQYVDKIVCILKDSTLYEKLSYAGRKKIENGFTIENMIDKLSTELNFLCEDQNAKKEREFMSQALNLMNNFATDYYTTYQQFATKALECEHVWAERCWFENKWNEAKFPSVVSVPLDILRKCWRKVIKVYCIGLYKIRGGSD
jgi:glycosyltransferase involved in cell wall biosynthesis